VLTFSDGITLPFITLWDLRLCLVFPALFSFFSSDDVFLVPPVTFPPPPQSDAPVGVRPHSSVCLFFILPSFPPLSTPYPLSFCFSPLVRQRVRFFFFPSERGFVRPPRPPDSWLFFAPLDALVAQCAFEFGFLFDLRVYLFLRPPPLLSRFPSPGYDDDGSLPSVFKPFVVTGVFCPPPFSPTSFSFVSSAPSYVRPVGFCFP